MSSTKQHRKVISSSKTRSELLFEAYLKELGLPISFEPKVHGKNKRPDYSLEWNGRVIQLDVKELQERLKAGACTYDSYKSIRKKIQEARQKFHEYNDNCCILVLNNRGDWTFRDKPWIVFSAMLGDLGFSKEISIGKKAAHGRMKNVFLDNGSMSNSRSHGFQNQTISAIAVLSEFTIPNPDFEREYQRRLKKPSAGLLGDDKVAAQIRVRLDLYKKMRPSLGTCPRLSVYENPFARIVLPPDFMKGSYDVRFRWNDTTGDIQRVYVGAELRQIEQNRLCDLAQQIDEFRAAVVRQFKPTKMILFGSHAYGTPGEHSDVDLVVVFPGNGDSSHRSLEIRQSIDRDFPMDLICYSEGELNKRMKAGDSFLAEVVENGFSLYEA